jgi:hypothetical protein
MVTPGLRLQYTNSMRCDPINPPLQGDFWEDEDDEDD